MAERTASDVTDILVTDILHEAEEIRARALNLATSGLTRILSGKITIHRRGDALTIHGSWPGRFGPQLEETTAHEITSDVRFDKESLAGVMVEARRGNRITGHIEVHRPLPTTPDKAEEETGMEPAAPDQSEQGTTAEPPATIGHTLELMHPTRRHGLMGALTVINNALRYTQAARETAQKDQRTNESGTSPDARLAA